MANWEHIWRFSPTIPKAGERGTGTILLPVTQTLPARRKADGSVQSDKSQYVLVDVSYAMQEFSNGTDLTDPKYLQNPSYDSGDPANLGLAETELSFHLCSRSLAHLE